MNTRTAKTFLPCYRSGIRADVRILKAARIAEGDSSLRPEMEEQARFDQRMLAAIRALEPPPTLRERLDGLDTNPAAAKPLRSQLAHPTLLCAAAGVLLFAGFLVFQELDRREDFPGKESVERMIAGSNEMSGVELDPANAPAGQLGDAVYMRGFEGFALPGELAQLPAVGLRVFKQNGRPVAQLAIDRHETLLYVFRASDFGLDLGEAREWKIFTQAGWAAALRSENDLCSMLTFRGSKEEMQNYVVTLKP